MRLVGAVRSRVKISNLNPRLPMLRSAITISSYVMGKNAGEYIYAKKGPVAVGKPKGAGHPQFAHNGRSDNDEQPVLKSGRAID